MSLNSKSERVQMLTSIALAWCPDTSAGKFHEIDELYDDHTGLPA